MMRGALDRPEPGRHPSGHRGRYAPGAGGSRQNVYPVKDQGLTVHGGKTATAPLIVPTAPRFYCVSQ